MTAMIDCRVPFAETLIALAEHDERIVAVCNDSIGSSNLGEFAKRFPKRLINVGIAEQNMIGVGAGLANAGLIPFVCGAGPFLSGRATEQIKADIAYSGANVKLCAMSPGFAYGELGPTHHSIEDFSWIRAIDHMALVVPADEAQTRDAVRWAAEHDGGVYMRIGRTKVRSVSSETAPAFTFGTANRVADGADVTIIATGTMVSRAIDAASLLAVDGLTARVINMSTIEPLDYAEVVAAARETGAIVTAEEAVSKGGLGAAVAAVVVTNAPVPMRIMGTDHFAPTGSVEWLFEHYGLTAAGIASAAREAIGAK
jgi:transketolase